MTNTLFLIMCVVAIGALSIFTLRTQIALNEKKLEMEMERAGKNSEVKTRINSIYGKEILVEKKLSSESFNTLIYYRGRAEGIREAIKAVKAIREFPKRNYIDIPQRLVDFMSGVLEECERQLRYNEANCIKSTREERVLGQDERDKQQYGIPLTYNAVDGDDTP